MSFALAQDLILNGIDDPDGIQVMTIHKSRVQGYLSQFLLGPLPGLLGQVPRERHRLLKMKYLEVLMARVLFKPAQGFGGGVHCLLAMPLGFFQIGEVFAIDLLIFWVVFRRGFSLLDEATIYGGEIYLT